jgi:hypothetical protein
VKRVRRDKFGVVGPYMPNNGLRFFADGAAKKWPLRGSLRKAAARV